MEKIVGDHYTQDSAVITYCDLLQYRVTAAADNPIFYQDSSKASVNELGSTLNPAKLVMQNPSPPIYWENILKLEPSNKD